MRWFSTKYIYRSDRYEDTFLINNSPCNSFQPLPVEEVVYCFWTGNNAMSEIRSNCFQTMLNTVGVPVKLITPQNLNEYILNDYPLHPAFENLSLVHKSDYLRCYFMHHYGGGYADIKRQDHSWSASFREFNSSAAWVMGYREVGARVVAVIDGKLGKDLRRNWKVVVGNGSYICRPYSPFTTEWYNELHHRMDNYAQRLAANPGNVMGDNEGYPIPWTNILGDIFHPLCLKYHEHLSFSETIKPNFTAYR